VSRPALDVIGVGSMVVDRVHRAPRILGRDEKAILRDVAGAGPVRSYVGGVVLNHLGWAAALGLRAGVFGRQADDEGGRFLRAAMQRLGIATSLDLSGSASSVAEIFVDDAGGRAIYMAPGATSETAPGHIREHAEFIKSAARLTTEVSQLPLAAAREALAIAREAGVPTVVDLDVPPSAALAGLGDEATLHAVLRAADLLKPAKGAARELVPDAGNDPLVMARALRERFGNAAVVLTDGEAGCAIAAEKFEGFVPARAVKALDTTGAGDAFLGGLLAGLHHGLGWKDAARLANACGAACAEKLGAFPDDPAAARARVLELYAGPDLTLAPVAPSSPPGAAEDPAASMMRVAIEELDALRARHDRALSEAALGEIRRAIDAGGRLHLTGIGKCEHVAHYAASLFASTGTPATFLHATETSHGSAGQVVDGDLVIAISNSGTSAELLAAVAAVRGMGARVIAVTGGLDSPLARAADVTLDAGVRREGGPLGLAPRASVAAQVLVLAALAAARQAEIDLTPAEYQRRHPAGALGVRAQSQADPTRE
jgi:arabinose-5-phosphate isomerase